jgi:broad specificity phosphatase PhoE
MLGRLVLVRHGETAWSRSGRHTGSTDLPLEAAGRQQAETLATRLGTWRFARVFTSPRRRALETCALAGLGARAQVVEDLAEWDYGEYEGLTTRQIREVRPGWSLWRDGAPGGEDPATVSARADRVIGLVLARAGGGDAALFAHGHMLRVLGARWIGLDAAAGEYLVLGAGALSVLGYEQDSRALVCWNDLGADPEVAPP